MDQGQLKIFIESCIDYFSKITGSPIVVGVPYVKENETGVLLAYSGVIGISGKMQGAVYITADEPFLTDLINVIMPGIEPKPQRLSDMVAELANTIAGNAQRTLGSDFHISIPMVLKKTQINGDTLELKAPTFIIPLQWKSHKAFLVIGLRK